MSEPGNRQGDEMMAKEGTPLMNQKPGKDDGVAKTAVEPPIQEPQAEGSAPKVNGIPFEEGVLVKGATRDYTIAEVKNATMEAFEQQPKMVMTVPVLQGKNAPKYCDIGVNGVIYRIVRGKPVKVPQAIYEAFNAANVVPSTNEPNVREPGN